MIDRGIMVETEALLQLQETDLAILRAKTKLSSLPERDKLLTIRSKKTEIQIKLEQVNRLMQKCEDEIKTFQHEDQMLIDKTKSVQEKIDNSMDYRLITSLTKDLEGATKRREKIGYEMSGLYDRLEKIETAQAQVNTAATKLAAQEEIVLSQYHASASQLQSDIQMLQARRESYAHNLSSELFARYEKLCSAKGGIGAGKFLGTHCSVCNVEFQEGQRKSLLQGASITSCPNCGRLLVVVREDARQEK